MVVEKASHVGGTAATSAGTIWIPGNRQSIELGFADSKESARDYLDELIGTPNELGLRRAYLESGPVAVDYLAAKTDVKFVPSGKHSTIKT